MPLFSFLRQTFRVSDKNLRLYQFCDEKGCGSGFCAMTACERPREQCLRVTAGTGHGFLSETCAR
jgi:hypothetical protein